MGKLAVKVARAGRKIKTFVLVKFNRHITAVGRGVIIEERVKFNSLDYGNGRLAVELGDNVRIYNDVLIQGSSTLSIGHNTFIGSYNVIGINESVKIGNNVYDSTSSFNQRYRS